MTPPPQTSTAPELEPSSGELREARRLVAEAAARLREAEEGERAEREAVECALPTRDGEFRLLAHERSSSDLTAALVHGDPSTHPAPVIHAHEACLLGDALGGLACDCGARLAAAQRAILEAGAGVLLYTKRSGSDHWPTAGGRLASLPGPIRPESAFLCSAGAGPDVVVGEALLRRLGVPLHHPDRRSTGTDYTRHHAPLPEATP